MLDCSGFSSAAMQPQQKRCRTEAPPHSHFFISLGGDSLKRVRSFGNDAFLLPPKQKRRNCTSPANPQRNTSSPGPQPAVLGFKRGRAEPFSAPGSSSTVDRPPGTKRCRSSRRTPGCFDPEPDGAFNPFGPQRTSLSCPQSTDIVPYRGSGTAGATARFFHGGTSHSTPQLHLNGEFGSFGGVGKRRCAGTIVPYRAGSYRARSAATVQTASGQDDEDRLEAARSSRASRPRCFAGRVFGCNDEAAAPRSRGDPPQSSTMMDID